MITYILSQQTLLLLLQIIIWAISFGLGRFLF
jgi:hypothetical protein